MEMAILDGNGVTIKNLDGDSITKEIHTIEWSAEMAEKQGFDHFMLKEIHEQPNAVNRLSWKQMKSITSLRSS